MRDGNVKSRLRGTLLALTLAALVSPLVGCGGDEGDGSSVSHNSHPVQPNDSGQSTSPEQPSRPGQDSFLGQSSVSDYDGPIELGGCTAPGPGRMPSAVLPQVSNIGKTYVIELGRWGISNNASNAAATTDGLNKALQWANDEGYGTVRLPAGTYLVGKKMSDIYTGGVVLPSNIHFELDPGATIQMAASTTENYCAVDISNKEDVIISGGTIRGDHDSHVPDHAEGHAICVWGGDASKRVLIEDMTLTKAAGDGVLINGGNDPYSQDVTIRNNDISDNRRQGISVVGGVNVVVENNWIHHTQGSEPQFGIDIEGPDYTNRDILIRNNSFYQNQGGDYVNTDGRNVWLIDNEMDQTGLDKPQTDGSIIFWRKSDQVIVGNKVTVTVGNEAGEMWGLISYANGSATSVANIIENNVFHGGGINVADMDYLKISGNTVYNHNFVAWSVSCLQFDDNAVNDNGQEYYPYLFRDARGKASGNLRDGKPVDIPLSPSSALDYQ